MPIPKDSTIDLPRSRPATFPWKSTIAFSIKSVPSAVPEVIFAISELERFSSFASIFAFLETALSALMS